MSDERDSATDHVLRAIIANTNDVQGEWVSLRTLKVTMVAHGRLDVAELQEALDQLEKGNKIHVDEEQYRPADGVERPPYLSEL